MRDELINIVDHRSRAKRRPGHLRILILIGGCRAGVSRYCSMYEPDYLIVADVARELEKVKLPDQFLTPYAFLPLGQDGTVDLLFSDASDAKRNAIRQLPGALTERGLNQIPEAGRQAGGKLNRSPDFPELVHGIVGQLVIASGGRAEFVEAIFKGSIVGGTNTGCAISLKEGITEGLKRLSIPVEVVYDLTGSATFAGIERRGDRNVAVSLPDFVCETLRKGEGADLLITSKVNLCELPPTHLDTEARTRFMLSDEQAQASSELRCELAIRDPNETLSSQMGGVSIREIDFAHHLDQETEVNPSIAKVYNLQIRDAFEQARPTRSLVSEIKSDRRATPHLRESPREIAERGYYTDFKELMRAVRQPAEDVRYRLTLRMVAGQEYELQKFSKYFSAPPKDLSDSRHRLRVLRSQLATVEDEASNSHQQCEEFRAECADRELAIEDAHLQLTNPRRPGLFRKAPSFEEALAALEQTIVDYRLAYDPLLTETALLKELQLGVSAIGAEERVHADELLNICDVLNSHILRGLNAEAPAYVIARPIDDVFSIIRNLPQQSHDEQRRTLAAQADIITIEGLARVVRAPTPRVEAIVERLLNAPFPIIGPPWAGKTRLDTPLVAYVLPSMLLEDAESIRRAISKRNARVRVAFTDSIQAAVNVVRYRLYRITSVEELFPEKLRQELLEACNGPLAALYDVKNSKSLRKLGIVIENGHVHFTNEILPE